ncbi:MAG: glycogen synthase GlgA [Pseudomonadota bacterium]
MTNVLSVTSECVPLVKTGGLADVAGALPSALAPLGIEMKVLLPGYRDVLAAVKGQEVAKLSKGQRLLAADHAGLSLLILDAPDLFDRDGSPYLTPEGFDWPDNPLRFAALSKAASAIAGGAIKAWVPDMVHCHDWQAGLAPYYIRAKGLPTKTVMTIHNIAFQGISPPEMLKDLDLNPKDFTADGLEYFGNISTLKAGLVYADQITTVSPTYARELMMPEFGMGLDGLLRHRRNKLTGILNGIDPQAWSPATDPHIKPYTTPAGKRANKTALRKLFKLKKSDGPLCVVISRLTEQKGLDLLLDALPALLERDGQLVLLGSGDPSLEHAFLKASGHPNVAVRIGYDEPLSHKMMAGADAILVPSRFEPCGLTQLYGLAYGTLPLVALTGGLADTVITANPVALSKPVATGLNFHPITAESLRNALVTLCTLYADPKLWAKLQRNAMSQPVDWAGSAQRYASLYGDLTE